MRNFSKLSRKINASCPQPYKLDEGIKLFFMRLGLPEIIFSAVVSVLVLFAPGALLGFALGLKRLWLWALAPLISLTLLSGAAVLAPVVSLQWNLLGVALLTLGFSAVIAAFFRFVLRARFNFEPGAGRFTPLIFAAAAAVLAVQMVLAVGSFAGISQTFDNVFHLNAIKHAEITGQASPFTIGGFTSPDTAAAFYPGMWHACVQLVQQLSGASLPVAINSFNLALMATVWPLGVMLLAREFAGVSVRGTVIGAMLAVVFPAFPLFMLQYGVLYPYFMGLCLLPGVLATTLNLLGVTKATRVAKRAPLTVLLLGLIPGLALTHPQGLMSLLALTLPAAIVACFAGFKQISHAQKLLRLTLLIAFMAVGAVMVWKLRPTNQWTSRMSFLEALQQTLLLQLWGYGLPILLAALTLFGALRALFGAHNRVRVSAFGMWLAGAGLFLISAGITTQFLRKPVHIWYGDAPRLASLFVIAVIPLLALTIAELLEKLVAKQQLRATAQATILGLLLAVSLLSAGFGQMFADTRGTYKMDAESPLLSTDEAALLAELAELVPADEVIVGSPWTGASLSYAFAGREALLPHMFMGEFAPERSLVTDSLDEAVSGSPICDAVTKLRAFWVLDFGSREVHGAEHVYYGFDELDSGNYELVKQIGEAKLYRVKACD